MLLVTEDDHARERLLAKLADLEHDTANEVASELLEARHRFEAAWHAARPAVPASMYLLVGRPLAPSFDLADLATGGRDLVRLLSDLQEHVRSALLDSIAKGGHSEALGGVSMTTEQITRLVDGLREGEGAVKLGLAEKINFEVTLLKAVDASRARAIDSLIKELTALADESPATAAPEGEKKKG